MNKYFAIRNINLAQSKDSLLMIYTCMKQRISC